VSLLTYSTNAFCNLFLGTSITLPSHSRTSSLILPFDFASNQVASSRTVRGGFPRDASEMVDLGLESSGWLDEVVCAVGDDCS
jgi:hypothetical protein